MQQALGCTTLLDLHSSLVAGCAKTGTLLAWKSWNLSAQRVNINTMVPTLRLDFIRRDFHFIRRDFHQAVRDMRATTTNDVYLKDNYAQVWENY